MGEDRARSKNLRSEKAELIRLGTPAPSKAAWGGVIEAARISRIACGVSQEHGSFDSLRMTGKFELLSFPRCLSKKLADGVRAT